MDNDSPPTRSNSTEEAYVTLVNSYINATRDILNGYMTFENGLTRTINNRVLINFINNNSASRAATAAAAPTATATARAPEQAEEPPVSAIETPIVQRETTQMPDTPARPSLRFHSNPSSSPFQIPTPVRLTSRLDRPDVEEREPFFTLPRRRVGLSQPQSQPQLRDDPVDPVPRQTFAGAVAGASSPTPTPPFASTFVRYRLPVQIGAPRRVPATSASASDDTAPHHAAAAATIPRSTRNLLEVPIFSPPQSPSPLSHSISPVRQRQQQERQQQERQQQERQQRELNSLSPILPVEPTHLPPAPSLTSTASRLMLNLLDTPRFNDSLVYYTQIIERELSRSRQGHTLSYDVIQQQTKIIPYCTINNPLNDICPISQVPFDLIDSVMQINSCKHNFNPYSLIRWFDTHSTCPMCRQQIDVDVDVENEDYDEQTIHMYNNDGNEEPYRSELNRYNENNYNFDSEL